MSTPPQASPAVKPDARNFAFLGEFFRSPGKTGAVLPSSPALAGVMVDWLDFESLGTIVEFGPGTGAFTYEIARRLRPGATYLGLEINSSFAAHLRGALPELEFHERSAADVAISLREAGAKAADAIVSGLPWAVFSEEDQDEILEAAASVLAPGGSFATFAYIHGLLLPAGRRFRERLGRTFTRVETSPISWRNFPPAFVYRCRK